MMLIQLTQPRARLSPSQRLRFFWLSWLGIFVIAMAVDMGMPFTFWGALVRLPVNLAVGPAAVLTGIYFIQGPRRARRHWLLFRFILANFCNSRAVADYPKRVRRPRPRKTIYPFWWMERRRPRR